LAAILGGGTGQWAIFGTADLDNDIEDQAVLPVTRLLNLAPSLDDVVGMRLELPRATAPDFLTAKKISLMGYGQAAGITVNSAMLCRDIKLLT
jgi:hypothetical protein